MVNMETKEHFIDEVSSGLTLDTLVYIFSLFVSGLLLFLLVYFIITLSDLECDYLNAQQCCNRLNMWVLPKLVVHTLLSLVFAVSGHYWLLLASLPLAIYFGLQYKNVPPGNFGVYDPTEILKLGQIRSHVKDSIIGIVYYLIFFFIYLYCLLTHLVKTTRVPKPSYSDDIGL
ncbi:UNVERIFIED_CONTAM: hypothetical protein RMT77_002550 [Armadillidium vulgare]